MINHAAKINNAIRAIMLVAAVHYAVNGEERCDDDEDNLSCKNEPNLI